MDETTYAKLADETLRALLRELDELDSDEAETDRAGDVLTIAFRSGKKCIINTQRPTRQLWMAHGTTAWHFDYDAARASWQDDKGRGELHATLRQVIEQELAR